MNSALPAVPEPVPQSHRSASPPGFFRAHLNPRNSLAARLGWAHIVITVVAAVTASSWIAITARDRIEENTGVAFQQYATQISNEIDSQLDAKLQWLTASTVVFGYLLPDGRGHRAAPLLAEFRRQAPEFEWIALSDASGQVLAADGDLDTAHSVREETWFKEGLHAAWLDDLNWRTGEPKQTRQSPGFLRISAPVKGADGKLAGVLGAQLSLDWVRSFGGELTESLRARRVLQVLVINQAGVLLFGPSEMLGKAMPGQPSLDIQQAAESLRKLRASGPMRRNVAPAGHVVADWPDGIPQLSGWSLSDGYGHFTGVGWTVWVREPTSMAFESARQQQWRALLIVLGAGLAIIVAGLLLTRRLTRQLGEITRSADDIRAGKRSDLMVSPGHDEAARIGHSLQALLVDLQGRTRALEDLNRELDARVAARSREVERLADENRHAALMRERLRLARDLHDTLAQSLMSLLAEIRVMRMLARSDPQSLPEELERAEKAAQDGLREAREAIVTLRHHPVRDTGLGPAIEQLAWRTEERSGLVVNLRIDAGLATLADSRAEMVYRVSEEALRNVQRHAHARTVDLHVDCVRNGEAATLRLEVTDDGNGFDPGTQDFTGHFGVLGMREQAELLDGELSIVSSVGDGTTVTLSVPL